MAVKELNQTRNTPVDFSTVIDLRDCVGEAVEVEVCPDDDQRRHLLGTLGLLAIEDWIATAHLSRTPDGQGVSLRVKLAMNVVQSCVVTLEPVRTRIEHVFHNLYVPDTQISADQIGDEIVIDNDEDEFPEVLAEEGVDIGAAITEQLALILDPYPKREGASPHGGWESGAADEREGERPFAALKSWHS